jgi:hypothetical protein
MLMEWEGRYYSAARLPSILASRRSILSARTLQHSASARSFFSRGCLCERLGGSADSGSCLRIVCSRSAPTQIAADTLATAESGSTTNSAALFSALSGTSTGHHSTAPGIGRFVPGVGTLQGSANTRWISTLAARFGVVLNNGVLLYGKATITQLLRT